MTTAVQWAVVHRVGWLADNDVVTPRTLFHVCFYLSTAAFALWLSLVVLGRRVCRSTGLSRLCFAAMTFGWMSLSVALDVDRPVTLTTGVHAGTEVGWALAGAAFAIPGLMFTAWMFKGFKWGPRSGRKALPRVLIAQAQVVGPEHAPTLVLYLHPHEQIAVERGHPLPLTSPISSLALDGGPPTSGAIDGLDDWEGKTLRLRLSDQGAMKLGMPRVLILTFKKKDVRDQVVAALRPRDH